MILTLSKYQSVFNAYNYVTFDSKTLISQKLEQKKVALKVDIEDSIILNC